ncbi:GH25 family lysozyme [Frankia sp. Cppng1_Ct_nod]|uniref:GH25 family lysozyme n=1 Tax=Frankia sp. Cppng1_Ct_nod TaxID=2897162 RepID=UPI001F5EDDC8|nr:GH25 family lysozyme [Frankia sp. Cppng1_Ct_nod]
MHVTPSTACQDDDPGPGRRGRPRRRRQALLHTGTTAAAVMFITVATVPGDGASGPTAPATRHPAMASTRNTDVAIDTPTAGTDVDVLPVAGTTTTTPTGETPAGTRSMLAIPAGWPKGVDVSSWQHSGSAGIDWSGVRSAGIRFAVIKATEGKSYTNPYFAADHSLATQAGLAVGAYHYARPVLPIATAVEQADRFLSVTGLTRSDEQLAPVLDLEVDGGLSTSQLTEWTRTFLEEVETRTGRAPILYTYRSFWTDTMQNNPSFSGYPLWFAIYNGASSSGGPSSPGALPGGWTKWLMWQYTPSALVRGITGYVDMSRFCCSLDSLSVNADGRLSEIDRRYNSDALVRSLLAAAIRDEEPAGGGGRWRQFERGLLFWSVATGVHEVHGGISTRYLILGGSNSFLGRPTSDEIDAEVPGSRQSVFQGGRIYWSRFTGAHEVHGTILSYYLSLGAAGSELGLPVSDEYSVAGGRQSTFQFGSLRWDASSGTVTIVRP